MRGYGAELIVGGDRYADALAASEAWAARSGALPVHAFDQEETLLGRDTLALELARQAPGLDTGAAAFSALLSGGYVPGPDERVGVVLSGGKTTAVDFGR